MSILKCMVIDDEGVAVKAIEFLISKTATLTLVASATNPMKGLEILRKTDIDVLFLDVQMEPIDGFELLQQINPKIKVVLCTSHRETAVEAFDFSVFDFLTKPIAVTRFLQCAQKLVANSLEMKADERRKEEPDYFIVPAENKSKRVRVNCADIEYIEAHLGGVQIHFIGKELPLFTNKPLKKVESFLLNGFMRVHDRFIIALARFDRYENGYIILKDSKKRLISLGGKYKVEFFAFMDKLSMP